MWKPNQKTKKQKPDIRRGPRERLRNEKGVILVTVIILSFVMAILALGIMGLNANQARLNEHQVDRLRAQELGKGVLWYSIAERINNGSPSQPFQWFYKDGKCHQAAFSQNPGAGPNGTDTYTITITYPHPRPPNQCP